MGQGYGGCTGGCCGGCAGGGCAGCGGDGTLTLTALEREILELLAATPFLPAGFRKRTGRAVCRELPGDEEACSDALRALEFKRLVSLDADIPLAGFDYAAYVDFPHHGSLALTARGQQVLELLELQGTEDAEC